MKNSVASFRPLPLICVAQNIYLALEILGASFYEVQIKTVIGAIIDSVSDYRIQADARTIYYADYVSKSLHCTLFPWLIFEDLIRTKNRLNLSVPKNMPCAAGHGFSASLALQAFMAIFSTLS